MSWIIIIIQFGDRGRLALRGLPQEQSPANVFWSKKVLIIFINIIEANEDGNYVEEDGNVIDINGSYLLLQVDPLYNANYNNVELSDDSNCSSSDDEQSTIRGS